MVSSVISAILQHPSIAITEKRLQSRDPRGFPCLPFDIRAESVTLFCQLQRFLAGEHRVGAMVCGSVRHAVP